MTQNFWRIVAMAATGLHPDRLHSLADRVERSTSLAAAEGVLISVGLPGMDMLVRDWRQRPEISIGILAAGLRAASAAAAIAEEKQSIDLVWTGPATTFVPLRRTEQVLLETIALSRRRLFIVSFVAYELASVVGALVDAIERGVLVSVLLERPSSQGGNVNFDSLAAMRKAIPAVHIYVWEDSVLLAGSMHAKCAVADEEAIFITSANLTRAALERNIELGVFIRGGDAPRDLHRHLDALIATRKLTHIE